MTKLFKISHSSNLWRGTEINSDRSWIQKELNVAIKSEFNLSFLIELNIWAYILDKEPN